MDKEYRRVAALLSDSTEEEYAGRKFITGVIGNNTVVLTQCGIGKVNAAIGTTELINRFRPDAVISTGVAGGASTDLNVQEVVVATEACYHDAYCGSECAYGQIIGAPARFACDASMLAKATALDCETKITAGLIVTGDWFVDAREKMSDILSHFPEAQAVDMESAAIAHTCSQYGIPFISFRIISDIPLKDNKAEMYYNFWETIADNSFNVTKTFLESL